MSVELKISQLFAQCFARLTVGAAILLAVSRAAAADDINPTGMPIKIDHCTVAEQAALDNPKIGLRMSSATGLTIVYVNERDVAAREVRFRVRYQGETFTFVDRGSFAPQVKISRQFTTFNAIFSGSSADCSVTSAAFSDGSRWDAPEPAPVPASRH